MKKKIKKKYKGIRYIAKVLQKYGGKKYKGNYKQALTKSKEVLKQLQGQGQKIRVNNILQVTRKHRVTKPVKQKPLLFYKFLLELNHLPLEIFSQPLLSLMHIEIEFFCILKSQIYL